MYPFFFNDTATTEIYTLSLHDALPISKVVLDEARPTAVNLSWATARLLEVAQEAVTRGASLEGVRAALRSEEHTSELQSRQYLVCRLLLEKKNKRKECV